MGQMFDSDRRVRAGHSGAIRISWTLQILTALLCFSLFWGCAGRPRPSSESIQQAVASEYPQFIKLESFSMEASEDAGTNVDPVYRTRYSGQLGVTAQTFRQIEEDEEAIWLTPCEPAGKKLQIHGRTESHLVGGEWKTQVSEEGTARDGDCRPKGLFDDQAKQSGRVAVVQGSAEAAALLAKREQAEKAKIALLTSHPWSDHGNTTTSGTTYFKPDGSYRFVNSFMGNTFDAKWTLRASTITLDMGGGANNVFEERILQLTPDLLVIQGNAGTSRLTR